MIYKTIPKCNACGFFIDELTEVIYKDYRGTCISCGESSVCEIVNCTEIKISEELLIFIKEVIKSEKSLYN